MAVTPFHGKNYVREVLIQTSAQWATNLETALQAFETGRESDTGKEKTGPGLWGELDYDAPQGQLDTLPTGSPASTDLIAYNAQTAAVAATASFTCADKGTTGATLIVGGKLYAVVASGATGDQINAGNDGDEFAANIAAKVTTDTATTRCTADDDTNDVNFTANTAGAAGNDIQLESNDNIIDDLVAFHGGVDEINDLQATTVANVIASAAPLSPSTRLITAATDTILQADNGKIIIADRATGQTLTVTAPIAAGFNCLIVQKGAGTTTIAGSGTTIRQRQSFDDSAGQYAVMSLVAYEANVLALGGDLA